jgi:hypothetical protein
MLAAACFCFGRSAAAHIKKQMAYPPTDEFIEKLAHSKNLEYTLCQAGIRVAVFFDRVNTKIMR